MFKSLLATCLLIFSCSGAPRQEVQENNDFNTTILTEPQRLNQNVNFLQGSYCLRDTIDWDTYNDFFESYSYSYVYDIQNGLKILYHANHECHAVDLFEVTFEHDFIDIYYHDDSNEY